MRRTKRLLLRPFADGDRAAFAALNADPEVMKHFPAPLTRAQSDHFLDVIEEKRAAFGFSFNAVEADGRLVGLCGLSVPIRTLPASPCVEIGWRLARDAWGQGYASEAARDALDQAFGSLGIDEVVAFTSVGNARSTAVMERIGMSRDHDGDFDHPSIDEASPLRRHVLYRIRKDDHDDR